MFREIHKTDDCENVWWDRRKNWFHSDTTAIKSKPSEKTILSLSSRDFHSSNISVSIFNLKNWGNVGNKGENHYFAKKCSNVRKKLRLRKIYSQKEYVSAKTSLSDFFGPVDVANDWNLWNYLSELFNK